MENRTRVRASERESERIDRELVFRRGILYWNGNYGRFLPLRALRGQLVAARSLRRGNESLQ